MEDSTRQKIFTFGSNTSGRHSKGAALTARREHGAIYGQGSGLQGNSYAIPTRGYVQGKIKTLSLMAINDNVMEFLHFVYDHPELEFWVTRVGCGYAGWTDGQIAPMFEGSPENVILPKQWGGEGFSE